MITFWFLAIAILPLGRKIARRACKRAHAYQQNTVIVGAGEVGQLIARKLLKHPEYGLNVVGFIDRDPKTRRADLPEHLAILGGPERLPEIVKCLDVERVVIAFSNEPVSELLSLLRQLRAFPVQIDLVPRLFELVGPRLTVHAVEGLPLLGLPPNRASRTSRDRSSASIDAIGAGIALIVLLPAFAYIALRIRLDSDGPVFFRRTRLGTNMKEFTALQFRTMKTGTYEPSGQAKILRLVSAGTDANENGGVSKLERADCGDDVRSEAAANRSRRAAEPGQCPQGRHVLGRTAPVHALRGPELRAPSSRAVFHATGHHRPAAGHRTRRLRA